MASPEDFDSMAQQTVFIEKSKRECMPSSGQFENTQLLHRNLYSISIKFLDFYQICILSAITQNNPTHDEAHVDCYHFFGVLLNVFNLNNVTKGEHTPLPQVFGVLEFIWNFSQKQSVIMGNSCQHS